MICVVLPYFIIADFLKIRIRRHVRFIDFPSEFFFSRIDREYQTFHRIIDREIIEFSNASVWLSNLFRRWCIHTTHNKV
ncbi:hypothetical protein NY2A_b301L [Paramecium bursaria Chlorella virus NY2A]|uniref:Uncharacterized protein b301L n=1 Tax=Paramecium bursaria Chlorella virus NY2A TaxID=46021 RepID=A7IWH6_PBCVN|nr:hypothetical protein NY2A_b301L [Paramecium bursaria Chlorella virus NY2A]ABT14700.1 hypothetical protein NY2A_b301L [Paramecium bursaria Chlorella virus NY2A]